MLGFIVEKVTGAPLERCTRSTSSARSAWPIVVTRWCDKQTRCGPRFTGTIAPLPVQPIPSAPTPPFRGDGGLYSTIQDYGRFVGCCSTTNARLGPDPEPRVGEDDGRNQIGAIFVERQPDANQQRTRPFPLGAGKDKFGLGFQIAANDPAVKGYRSPGSLSWAGIFNTEFWIDPVRHIGGVHMMQLLPFYDDGAIRALRGFEETVYKHIP